MALPTHVNSEVNDDFTSDATVTTDCLVVGTGPAGASLACFLIAHGIKTIMISHAPGTANTPRAHLLNMAGMECLRDVGLEDECLRLGNGGDALSSIRWCRSMVGEEYGRIHSWGHGPGKIGEAAAASPCASLDLPQTLLEPILVRNATNNGAKLMFSTALVDFTQSSDEVTSTLRNQISGQTFRVRSRFLFGCDGARSVVAKQLGLSFNAQPGGGVAYNILINAELGDIMKHQKGQLHWIMQPDKDPKLGLGPVLRMIKPWKQWLLVCFPKPGAESQSFESSPKTNKGLIQILKDVIGDDRVPIEIVDVSRWKVNETVADMYSDGNVFCLGDAVHRHPPIFGLGSNTSIQDAYNISWKVALVLKGLASPTLLETYTAERQPVGAHLVTQSNAYLRNHATIWEAIGMFGETIEERVRQNKELSESSAKGAARRAQLYSALERATGEGDGLGIVMNQWYTSQAIYTADESPREPFAEDPLFKIRVGTYPGNRLPHAWLSRQVPSKPVSTIDLAGKTSFCLLTGHGGDAWREAAVKIGERLGLPINSYSIGWGLDYRDIYRDWEKRREVDEDGCVLVRPDNYVAWRSESMISGSCEEKLLEVLKSILGL